MVEVLAQQGAGSGLGRVVGWVVGFAVVTVVLGFGLMRLRRSVLGDDDGGEGPPLALSELRRLRDSGEISGEEYQRAVDAMARRARGGDAGGA